MGHPEPVFAWRSKFHDLLYKVDRTAPCRTIKAQPGKFTGPFHWKNRHFTTAELKRLQTFPDSYELKGGYGKVLEQIGNSVPPRLASVIAKAVKEQLFDRVGVQTVAARPESFISTFRQRQRARSTRFHEIAKQAIKKQYAKGGRPSKSPSGQASHYYVEARSLFDIERSNDRLKASIFEVDVSETSGCIELTFSGLNNKSDHASVIEIVGLSKYLPGYESLTATVSVDSISDVFHVWAAVEQALTERSRFFSLIDIYGHYANRGDTVDIQAFWNLSEPADLVRMLNFVSKTEHAGEFLNTKELQSRLGLTSLRFDEIVNELREIRFDVRTDATHPIIRPGRTLCTYPFPLLSPRALVESRAEFLRAGPSELAEAG
jgi:DNA (cytosine-5)-methyltransferase 1